VGGEQALHPHTSAREGVGDVHLSLVGICNPDYLFGCHIQSLEGSGQGLAIPDESCSSPISLKFTTSTDCHLEQQRSDRRQKDQSQFPDRVSIPAPPATAAEDHGELGDSSSERYRSGNGRGDRTDQDVTILRVGHLVSENSTDLGPLEIFDQALGDANSLMRRVASRCKSIRLRIRADVETGYGQTRAIAALSHDIPVLGQQIRVKFDGSS